MDVIQYICKTLLVCIVLRNNLLFFMLETINELFSGNMSASPFLHQSIEFNGFQCILFQTLMMLFNKSVDFVVSSCLKVVYTLSQTQCYLTPRQEIQMPSKQRTQACLYRINIAYNYTSCLLNVCSAYAGFLFIVA